MTNETELHQTLDAHVWADKWLSVIAEEPTIPTDRETMQGWFANAIMAGYDEGYRAKGRHMEHVDDLTDAADDDFFAPFDEVLGDAGLLVMALEDLRVHGRVWSIGHTEAEKLLAWLKYAMNVTAQERMADQDREANGLQRVAVL